MMRFVPSRKSTAYEQRQSAVCNQRWTLLLQHMSEAGLPYALVTDSDTLLFVKPSELLQELSPQCDVALVLHEPPQLPVNPGSVFLSVRGLRDFVRFASELLAQLEPSPHDMRLWAWYAYINQAAQLDRAFAKELDTKAIEALIEAGHVARPQYKVCSLARLMNHSATFDDNLKFSRGFIQMPYTDEKSQRSFKFKVVQWNRTDGMPYFMRERQSLGNAKHRFAGPKYVRALALHFQGTKKTFMDGYTVSDHTLCGRRPDQANQSAPATDAQWCRCMSPACETCLPHFCDLISPSLVPPQ
ncbi:hypothetical protein FVE85_6891 [Porphyridium purpureum]|uniref:Nucleotide-diphospho-sugar transferase domain-containing protein n=1 Tax=Porphyridium purpureum TaxID=35688 RepID=A0A5J4Z6J1_PORPP|nr:hypothetical protein FVE85_6891 [Porphyridium purpureum]|eukprot:POR8750..scf295_1